MKYRLSLVTYDPDIIRILDRLDSRRAKLIEMALAHYIGSRKGKEAVRHLVSENVPCKKREGRGVGERRGEDEGNGRQERRYSEGKTSSPDREPKQISTADKLDLDKFL